MTDAGNSFSYKDGISGTHDKNMQILLVKYELFFNNRNV